MTNSILTMPIWESKENVVNPLTHMSFIGSKGRNTNIVVGHTRICRIPRKECSVRTSWESKELRENPSMSFHAEVWTSFGFKSTTDGGIKAMRTISTKKRSDKGAGKRLHALAERSCCGSNWTKIMMYRFLFQMNYIMFRNWEMVRLSGAVRGDYENSSSDNWVTCNQSRFGDI